MKTLCYDFSLFPDIEIYSGVPNGIKNHINHKKVCTKYGKNSIHYKTYLFAFG